MKEIDLPSTNGSTPKYPEITVKLIGQDGNAFSILGQVQKAMKAADLEKIEMDEFLEEAMSGDYNHLLRTVMEWVVVE